MDAGRTPASPTRQAAVVGAVSFATYLLTRTRDLGGDDTVFAMAVGRVLSGHGVTRELFHPHHPIYNPIVAAVCWVLRLVGFHPFVSDVGAAVSALAAALVAGGVVLLLRRAGVREGPALLAGVVAGASGGLWQFGTCMEVYALTAAAVLLWLAAVGRDNPKPLPAGASVSLAMLGHLTAGLLVVPTAIRLRARPASAAWAVAVGVGLAGVALAAMLALFHHAYTPGQWFRTVLPARGGSYLGAPAPLAMLGAVRDLLVWRWYRSVPVFTPAATGWLDVAGAVAAALALVVLAAGLIAAVTDRHPLAVAASLAIAAYLPLWLMWDVGNVEHTVAATPLFATVLAFGAAKLPRRYGEALLGAVALLLIVANGLGSAVPQSKAENSRAWVIASFVSKTVPADGVLLTVGVEPRLRLALPYLSGRRVVSLTLDVESARAQGRPPSAALAYWMEAGRGARSLWVTPDALDRATSAWVENLGIPSAVWSRVVAGARPLRRRMLPADGVVIKEPFVLTEISVAGAH
jgi:hypothetical protein